MSQQKVIAYLEKKENACPHGEIPWRMKDATGPFLDIHFMARTPYGVILKLHRFCKERNLKPEFHNSMELITNPNFYEQHYLDHENFEMIVDADVEYYTQNELSKF